MKRESTKVSDIQTRRNFIGSASVIAVCGSGNVRALPSLPRMLNFEDRASYPRETHSRDEETF